MITVLYGPQGAGKTRNAELLRKFYGRKKVVEADESRHIPGNEPLDGSLLLTNHPNGVVRHLPSAVRVEHVHVSEARPILKRSGLWNK